jgi:hypothetical protein
MAKSWHKCVAKEAREFIKQIRVDNDGNIKPSGTPITHIWRNNKPVSIDDATDDEIVFAANVISEEMEEH